MAQSFSNIFSSFFGSSSEGRAVGVDIGSSAIKVVELSSTSNSIKLETYGALALGPYIDKHVGHAVKLPTKSAAEALSDVLSEAKVSTLSAGVAIPFSATLMQVMDMPRVSKDELEKMVPIEARKYIPTSMSEVSLDWTVVSEDDADTIQVLIVAVHNDVVHRYQQIVEDTKLQSSFFEVEIFSTIRAVLPDEDAPVLVLDMGADSTKLYVLSGGLVRRTHTINKGSQELTKAVSVGLDVSLEDAELYKRGMKPEGETNDRTEEVSQAADAALDQILTEADKFKRGYERNADIKLTQAVLMGGGVGYWGVFSAAKRKFGIETVQANPFAGFETPDSLDAVLAQNGPEFVVATGLATRKLKEA